MTEATKDSSVQRPKRPIGALSANQLMAVELGLFLLGQVKPAAAVAELTGFLSGTDEGFTPKQQKMLKRARLLIGQFSDQAVWLRWVEIYAKRLPEHLRAFDVKEDLSGFKEKRSGFIRNRLYTLKRLFD